MPSFICHACQFQQEVSERYAGKSVKCPQCSRVSKVENDELIAIDTGPALRSTKATEGQPWHSNPWIITVLILLFTAVNIGMIMGGIYLVAEYHISAARSGL